MLVERPMWLHDDTFFLENNCLNLLHVESSRERWVNEADEARGDNGELASVFMIC